MMVIILIAFYFFHSATILAQSPVDSPKRLVINEIMYKSLKEFDTDDWIEIYNPNDFDINISGWLLKDDKDSRHFAFPNNTIVKKRDFIVIIENEKKFNRVHPEVKNYVGTFTFGFGTNDMVRIYDNNLKLIDSVHYTNESPWYPETDGLGPSLELISPELDNTKPQSWRPSLIMHGTPGKANSVATVEINNSKNDFHISVSPNPITVSANIEFVNTSDGFLTIEIYDVFGRLVKTVLEQYMTSGKYATYWDGNDDFGKMVPHGVYFLSVKTQQGGYSQKIIK